MRTVKVALPMRLYGATVPIAVGAVVAGAGHWRWAGALLAFGFAWYVVGLAWWVRRVRRIRAAERLTTRDLIEIEHPQWARSLATGYIALVAGTTGLLILVSVIFVVVAVATK